MKHAPKKLMGDCVAGIFLPPMWREETEHTTALYNSMHTSRSIHDRILNCCFLGSVVVRTTYYRNYGGTTVSVHEYTPVR
jgi:hypothetical protein